MKYLFVCLLIFFAAIGLLYTNNKFSEPFFGEGEKNVSTSSTNSKPSLKGCAPATMVTGNCYPLKDINNNVIDTTAVICPQTCIAKFNSSTYGDNDYCQRDGDCAKAEPKYFFSNECEANPAGCCSNGHTLTHPTIEDPNTGKLVVDYNTNLCPVIASPSKCESTVNGCCADGVTTRTYTMVNGISTSSCSSEPPSYPTNCSTFKYQCCKSDGKTPSNTQNQLDSENTCPTGPPFYPTVPPYDFPTDEGSSYWPGWKDNSSGGGGGGGGGGGFWNNSSDNKSKFRLGDRLRKWREFLKWDKEQKQQKQYDSIYPKPYDDIILF
jgi:hypothetical protein